MAGRLQSTNLRRWRVRAMQQRFSRILKLKFILTKYYWTCKITAGTVYMMDAPPPYPGIINPQGTTVAGVDIGQAYPQQPGMYPQQQGAYPQQQGMYQQPGMYPQQGMYQQPQGMYQQQQPQGMYPQQPGMYAQQGYANGNPDFAPPPYNYNPGQQNGANGYPPSTGNKKLD